MGLSTEVLLDNAFAAGPPRWGVIAYLSGQGGLEPEAEGYGRAVLAAAAAGQCSAAVQIDGPHVAARWLAGPGGRPSSEPLGVVNMAAQETLEQFLSWAVSHVTAERYLLIVMGHGTGLATLSPELSGVAFDGGAHDALTVPELSGALVTAGAAGRPLAMVCLDSCYGASLEVAYRLRDVSEYLVAAPTRVPSPGLPWKEVLSRLDSCADSHHVAVALREHYQGELAGIDLRLADEVAKRLGSLVEALAADLGLNAPALRMVRSRIPSWGYRDEMCDLLSLADGLHQWGATAEVARRAGALADSVQQALSGASIGGAANVDTRVGGIGIFFPPTWEPVPPYYRDTYDLAADTGWADLLQSYYEATGSFGQGTD